MRRLVLPTALTVTTIAVTLACGNDDNGTSQQPIVDCSKVSATECRKCTLPDGGIDCKAEPTCFYDPGDDECHSGVA